MKRIALVPVLLALAAVAGGTLPASGEEKAQDTPVSFTKDIAPIIKASCEKCHNEKKSKGKLIMTSYAAMKKGGKNGPLWVEGDPDKSAIIKSVSGPEPEMPEEGDPLKPEQIKLLARWIKEGAKDDTK
jgi:mono/diheme cytochrome c family protein